MRILIVCYDFANNPFVAAGAYVRDLELARRWLGRGHEVLLLCGCYSGSRNGNFMGVPHEFVGLGGSKPVSVMSFVCGYSKWVARHGGDFDVIIEEWSPPFFPSFLPSLTPAPVILQVQQWLGRPYWGRYGPFSIHSALLERLVPRLYRHFVVLTPQMRDLLVPGSAANLAVINQGVDEEYLSVDGREEDYILFLGRFDIVQKGLDVLARAWPLVKKCAPEARLRLVGAKPGKIDDLRGLFDRYDDCHGVEFISRTVGSAKRDLIGACRFMVLPSRFEGQPLVLLEGAALGKPAVVSDIATLRWAVRAGFAVPSRVNDPAHLASVIIEVLRDDQRRARLSAQARQYAKERTWSHLTAEYECFLRRVITSQRRHARKDGWGASNSGKCSGLNGPITAQ